MIPSTGLLLLNCILLLSSYGYLCASDLKTQDAAGNAKNAASPHKHRRGSTHDLSKSITADFKQFSTELFEAKNFTGHFSAIATANSVGGRAAVAKQTSPLLRAYCEAYGLQCRGVDLPDVAARVWRHAQHTSSAYDLVFADLLSWCSAATRRAPASEYVQVLGKNGESWQVILSTNLTNYSSIPVRYFGLENVLQHLDSLRRGQATRGIFMLAGRVKTLEQCERLCVSTTRCSGLTWFGEESLLAIQFRCFGLDLSIATWSPAPHCGATTVVIIRQGVERASQTKHSAHQGNVGSAMQVLPGKFSFSFTNQAKYVGIFASANKCHAMCKVDNSCSASQWLSSKSWKSLHRACFSSGHNSRHLFPLTDLRRASFALKQHCASVSLPAAPTDLLQAAMPTQRLFESVRTVLGLDGFAKERVLVLVNLQKKDLKAAHNFICSLAAAETAQSFQVLWMCSDNIACAFLVNQSHRHLPTSRVLALHDFDSATAALPELARLQVAIIALLLKRKALLASVHQAWLQSPSTRLHGSFDLIGAPEQRLGLGFGFPLSSDFLLFMPTEGAINLALHLIRNRKLAEKFVDKGKWTESNLLNDLLFEGVAANGSLLPGRYGAQIRRPEWGSLRIKVLDIEEFPPSEVALHWWLGRAHRTFRVIVMRDDADRTAKAALGAQKTGPPLTKDVAFEPSSSNWMRVGESKCAPSQQKEQASPLIMVSLVVLFFNHAQNIPRLCKTILPCGVKEAQRRFPFSLNDRFTLQTIIVEDGSTDNSRQVWATHLAASSMHATVLAAHDGGQPAGMAFSSQLSDRSNIPGNDSGSLRNAANVAVTDYLLFAPNQHEIRSYHEGFALSWGDFLVTMQDDETFGDDPATARKWIADALQLFQAHPALAMISCNAGFLRTEGFACDMFDPQYKSHCCYINKTGCFGEDIAEIPYADPRLPSVPFMFVAGINFGPHIVRRHVYFDIGAFDTSYSSVGDPGIGYDIEYSLRAQQQGYLVGLMRCDGIVRRVGGGASLASKHKLKLRYLMERKNNRRFAYSYLHNASLMNEVLRRANSQNTQLSRVLR